MSETKYLKSENIKVFPLGSTRSTDPYGSVLSEQTLVKIIKSIVDKDSYVIRWNKDKSKIEFVLGGYYFDCILPKDNLRNYQWAQITINFDVYTGFNYLYNGTDDTENYFGGVVFYDSEPDHVEDDQQKTYELQILDENGNCPPLSFQRFNKDAFDFADSEYYITESQLSTKLKEYINQTQLYTTLNPYVKFENDTINSIDVINCGSATVLID